MPVLSTNLLLIAIATSTLVGLLSFLLVIILMIKVRRLKKNLSALLKGEKAAGLEEIILKLAESHKEMDKEIQELFEISNQIHRLAFRSIHKIGVIRFNPFKDVGGNLSFSVALMDGQNTGLIITSLHTREGNRVYMKPVTQGKSDQHPLTEEEKKAIVVASAQKQATN